MLSLTGAKDVLALSIVVLADAVVAIGLLVVAGVPVLHGEIGLAELRGAVAVLGEVTLVGARPALGAPRQELRRERERRENCIRRQEPHSRAWHCS